MALVITLLKILIEDDNVMRLTLGKRLGLGFGVLAAMGLFLGILAVYGVSTLATSLENVGTNRVPALQALASLNRERMAIRAQTLAVFSHETRTDTAASFRSIQQERAASWQKVDEAWARLEKIPRTSERGRALQAQLEGEYRTWRTTYVRLDGIVDQLTRVNDAAQKSALYAEYREIIGQMVPISDQMGKTFDAMTENNTDRTNAMIEQDRHLAAQLSGWAVAATAIGLVVAGVLGWLITRSVTAPLQYGVDFAKGVAKGDLTQRIDAQYLQRGDEIGDLAKALDEMTTQLRDMVGQVTQSTSEVSSAAGEIAQRRRWKKPLHRWKNSLPPSNKARRTPDRRTS